MFTIYCYREDYKKVYWISSNILDPCMQRSENSPLLRAILGELSALDDLRTAAGLYAGLHQA